MLIYNKINLKKMKEKKEFLISNPLQEVTISMPWSTGLCEYTVKAVTSCCNFSQSFSDVEEAVDFIRKLLTFNDMFKKQTDEEAPF